MSIRTKASLLAAALLALPMLAGAAQTPYASTYQPVASGPVLIRNATVLTGDGQRLEGADVLMRDGRIAAVADGAVVGSAIVDRIARNAGPNGSLSDDGIRDVLGFVAVVAAVVYILSNTAVQGILPPDALARVEVTPTREQAHGDMATNAAMVVAKPAGRKPIQTVTVQDVTSIRRESIPEGDGEKLMLTGDQNLVDLTYLVRWNIKDLKQFMFQLADPEQTVREVAEAAMRQSIAEVNLNDVMGSVGNTLMLAEEEEVTRP